MKVIFPNGATLVPLKSINTEGRGRKDFGDLQELAESIQEYGLIHPPTVTHQEGKVILVGGERRLRALELLGVDPIPVLFREEMSDAMVRELELFENIHRKEMTWQEEACQIYAIHKLRMQEAYAGGRSWGFRDTKNLVKRSLGHISHAIQTAKAILSGDEEVMRASSMMEAYTGILLKRKEQEILKKLGETGIGEKKIEGGEISINTSDLDDIFDNGIEIEDEEKPKEKPKSAPIEYIEFPLSEWFSRGDSVYEVMPAMEAESVDHIVTDPPYGIDLKNMDKIIDIDLVADTHQVEDNLKMLPDFLKEAYRVLRPNGYCIFWYDLNHHEKLRDWAREVGFKVCEWPIIWHKMHKCLNNVAQYNWTKNAEFAMVCRKGSPTLSTPQPSCIVQADGSIERQLYSNPFAKPAAAWEFILKPIGLKGQTILDPFAGQMSSARVILNLGMRPRCIEISEFHYQAGVEQIREMLNEMTGGKAKFR